MRCSLWKDRSWFQRKLLTKHMRMKGKITYYWLKNLRNYNNKIPRWNFNSINSMKKQEKSTISLDQSPNINRYYSHYQDHLSHLICYLVSQRTGAVAGYAKSSTVTNQETYRGERKIIENQRCKIYNMQHMKEEV